MRAYQGERGPRVPVWFMRQAGRSLPEYRALRVGTDMLDSCLNPELASEITLQPVRRHGVDAAIFFSDIVVPLRLVGVDVDIVPGKGPVLGSPIRTPEDVDRLLETDPASVKDKAAPIREAVERTVAGLTELGNVPLIGFAGAPFTLASYMIEGGPSKDHVRARTFMHTHPEHWQRLTEWIANLAGRFLQVQLEAGASAAQVFDSWAGALSRRDYDERVVASSETLISLAQGYTYQAGAQTRSLPIVHFGVGTSELLVSMKNAGADVVGVDYRISLDEASARLGNTVPVQGNIDPAFLSAPQELLFAHVDDVIRRGQSAPSHVLNLGHGVPPETDPTVLTAIVERVKAYA